MVRTRRRGAHRRPRAASTRTVVTVVLAVAAAAGISVLALSAGSRDATNTIVPVHRQAAPAASSSAPSEAATRCATAVALGRDVIAAAQPSYSHWAGHVRAQVDLDTGAATLEQARARWAATKATADADLAQFRTALAAFEPVGDGCAQGAAPASTAADPMLASCRSEFDAVTTAVTAATVVVDDWSHHVAMMKDKEHTDPAQYGQMWRDMVDAAPADLDRFASASLALTGHADCPDPR